MEVALPVVHAPHYILAMQQLLQVLAQLLEVRELHPLRRQFLNFGVCVVLLEGADVFFLVLTQALRQHCTELLKLLALLLSMLLENQHQRLVVEAVLLPEHAQGVSPELRDSLPYLRDDILLIRVLTCLHRKCSSKPCRFGGGLARSITASAIGPAGLKRWILKLRLPL